MFLRCTVSRQIEKIDFWDDVYGFDMSCIKKTARIEPSVESIRPENLCTQAFSLKSVDISTCKKEDLSFKAPFRLKVSRNDYLSSFVFHFDVYFSKCNPPICMTTGPRGEWDAFVCVGGRDAPSPSLTSGRLCLPSACGAVPRSSSATTIHGV